MAFLEISGAFLQFLVSAPPWRFHGGPGSGALFFLFGFWALRSLGGFEVSGGLGPQGFGGFRALGDLGPKGFRECKGFRLSARGLGLYMGFKVQVFSVSRFGVMGFALRFKLVDSRFRPGLLAKAEFSQCVRLLIAPEWIPESLQHRPTCLQTHLQAKPRANDTCVPIHVRVSACSD